MAFNLQEYILYRTEIRRELTNGEVDTNFKMVSNPWVAERTYEIGNIVYHPVVIENPTGSTGEDEEALAWWRANKRTSRGVFDVNEWDLIGGIGTGDLTIQGNNSFGKAVINYTGSTGTFQAGNDAVIQASTPDDTFRLIAGDGISLHYDTTTNTIKFINLGAQGETNHGVNVGTGTNEDVFAGMNGEDLEFRGLAVGASSSTALTISLNGLTKNIEFELNERLIDLRNINNGSPTMDMLSDVNYAGGPANGDILQWSASSSSWVPIPAVSGIQGPQGPQGTQGETGTQGIQGFTGSGTQGTQGAQGTPASTGIGFELVAESSTFFSDGLPDHQLAGDYQAGGVEGEGWAGAKWTQVGGTYINDSASTGTMDLLNLRAAIPIINDIGSGDGKSLFVRISGVVEANGGSASNILVYTVKHTCGENEEGNLSYSKYADGTGGGGPVSIGPWDKSGSTLFVCGTAQFPITTNVNATKDRIFIGFSADGESDSTTEGVTIIWKAWIDDTI